MITVILSLTLLLLPTGCAPDQPISYAPCYIWRDEHQVEVRDCPIRPGIAKWRAKRVDTSIYALYTMEWEQ